MQRFKLPLFSMLFIALLISFPSSNGDDDYEPSLENYDLIEDLPDDTNPRTATSQPNASASASSDFRRQKDGPKADLHCWLKLINEIFRRLTSVHDKMTDLLIYASGDSPGPDEMDATQNEWNLNKFNQINNLAEEELIAVYSLLKKELLTHSKQRRENLNRTSHGTTSPPPHTPWSARGKLRGDSPLLTDCGGSLSSENGTILYEYNQTQGQNCLWVISAPRNTDYLRIYVRDTGFLKNEYTQLSVGYFSNSQFDEPNTLIWRLVYLDQNATYRDTFKMDIPSVVAFVHFKSKPGPRGVSSTFGMIDSETRFSILFSSIPNNSTPSSLTFASSFQNEWNVNFGSAIPGHNSTAYASNQRTVFVFQPPKPNTSLFIKWYDIENQSPGGVVYDSLNIWAYGPSFLWRRIDQLCGRLNTEMVRSYAKQYDFQEDISTMIVTFQTDSSLGFTGFEGYMGRTLDEGLIQFRELGSYEDSGRVGYAEW